MEKNTLFILFLGLQLTCYGQSPNISYDTPQNYSVGVAITPLTPTNTGGVVPATIYGQVTTLAGSGSWGANDGIGTSASFNSPYGLTLDAIGNVYVADYGNHKIRIITPTGTVSTLAGSGIAGATNATGIAASFYYPHGVAVDALGNVFVADYYNHKIRKISALGVVSTFAGSGAPSSTDGMGTGASFHFPAGITIDGFGNLYVVDYASHKIRKITPSGVVSTLAGNGTAGTTDGIGTAAKFNYPYGIAVDNSGNEYVADSSNHKIRKISSSGVVSTFAGSGIAGSLDGLGIAAGFDNPTGIVINTNGNIYIADRSNSKIRIISPAGIVSTLAGNGMSGMDYDVSIGLEAIFNQPRGIAVDAMGTIYVADTNNHKIRKISTSGYTISPALPVGLVFDATTGTISGTPTATILATMFTITAYNSSGSSATTISLETSVLGTKTFNNQQIFSIYPNPTNNELFVKSSSDEEVNYSITNTIGQIIQQGILKTNQPIDLANIAAGLYLISIKNESYKFIKQ